ncbi:MAG TPA: hypothetical protein VIH61_03685 [Waddliaceae bacterium]
MEKTINIPQSVQEKCPYLTIRDFAKQYSTWTESSIRWLIYNITAGFNETVVRRVGKSKILLSVTDFWKWVEMQNNNPQQQTKSNRKTSENIS